MHVDGSGNDGIIMRVQTCAVPTLKQKNSWQIGRFERTIAWWVGDVVFDPVRVLLDSGSVSAIVLLFRRSGLAFEALRAQGVGRVHVPMGEGSGVLESPLVAVGHVPVSWSAVAVIRCGFIVLGLGTVDNVEIVANIVELHISVPLGIVIVLLGIIGTVTSV